MTAEFLIVTVLVAATPGTGVIYTLTHALAHGVGEGIPAAAGCAVSAVPHLVAAATDEEAAPRLRGRTATVGQLAEAREKRS